MDHVENQQLCDSLSEVLHIQQTQGAVYPRDASYLLTALKLVLQPLHCPQIHTDPFCPLPRFFFFFFFKDGHCLRP